MSMQIHVNDARTQKNLTSLEGLSKDSTVYDVKKVYFRQYKKYYPDRQSFKLEPRGKSLKDTETLSALGLKDGSTIYFKDLGPQVGWTTVFLTEYAGPLVIYLLFYIRPSCFYGAGASLKPRAQVVDIAAACWTVHYAKRLFETVFIHRFSHGTMPIMNIFKNSAYYWGFAAFVAYFVNHPLYTPPAFGDLQMYAGLGTFVFAELGNLSIHIALRNLRPAGSRVRRIPYAGTNPFTWLFSLVSCPNYTYEAMAWIGFSIMTQCVPAGLFCLAGFYQMSVWAQGKHRNYKKEFPNYPSLRKPIVPLLF